MLTNLKFLTTFLQAQEFMLLQSQFITLQKQADSDKGSQLK